MSLPKFTVFLILFFTCLSSVSHAQNKRADFGPPMDIPLFLSGNFAELRSNHFHTGIDIKTLGVEGIEVVAAEEGYVSRIGISPWGYGNALYIDHPNGYTTVYAHLKSFNEEITAAIRKQQYTSEAFKVDFRPTDTIFVKKGDFIALSGNTGGSRGAHLHFEIRDTETQRPQNPLKFGFDIKDDIAPRIRGVRFHPLSESSFINGENKAKSFVVTGAQGKYHLKGAPKIEIHGPFGMSLHALDYLNEQPNKCGIYRLKLDVDDKEICQQTFDELDFDTFRHINSYMDYEVFKQRSWHYHKSFVEPGNELEVYKVDSLMGVMEFEDDKTHHVYYEAVDVYGNKSTLNFDFISKSEAPRKPNPKPYDAYFLWNQENIFEYESEMGIRIPKGALYKDLKFQFGREIQKEGMLSPRYTVQGTFVPLQKAIEITIAPQWKDTPDSLKSKLVALRESVSGGKGYIGGELTEEGFKFKTKDFGKFHLVLDTIPPTMTYSKWSGGGHLNSRSTLVFRIKDNTGIKSYRGELNGKWVLLQYDAKYNKLWMDVGESKFSKGNNTLVITVEDLCGNVLTKTFHYTY